MESEGRQPAVRLDVGRWSARVVVLWVVWATVLSCAVALTAVHLLLAGWALRRVFAHARRTGLLARYSAEGVG